MKRRFYRIPVIQGRTREKHVGVGNFDPSSFFSANNTCDVNNENGKRSDCSRDPKSLPILAAFAGTAR